MTLWLIFDKNDEYNFIGRIHLNFKFWNFLLTLSLSLCITHKYTYYLSLSLSLSFSLSLSLSLALSHAHTIYLSHPPLSLSFSHSDSLPPISLSVPLLLPLSLLFILSPTYQKRCWDMIEISAHTRCAHSATSTLRLFACLLHRPQRFESMRSLWDAVRKNSRYMSSPQAHPVTLCRDLMLALRKCKFYVTRVSISKIKDLCKQIFSFQVTTCRVFLALKEN